MRIKDRKWLTEIQQLTDHSGGMYPGMHYDLLPPTVAQRLGGFIETYIPHNPIHKDRFIITEKGRAALQETP